MMQVITRYFSICFMTMTFLNVFTIVNVTHSSTQKGGPKSAKIGKQVWMVENLNVETFRNGDRIYYAKNRQDWELAITEERPAWCYYNDDPNNAAKYGKLYNWHAVKDPRGLAPKGWHIPTKDEFDVLSNMNTMGFVNTLKRKTGWNEDYGGNNKTGFAAVAGGYRVGHGFGDFYYAGVGGWWWSSSENPEGGAAWYFTLQYNETMGGEEFGFDMGLSIRCIKD